jgi:hypothetical protein
MTLLNRRRYLPDIHSPTVGIRQATEKGRRFADGHYTIDAKERFVGEYVFPP